MILWRPTSALWRRLIFEITSDLLNTRCFELSKLVRLLIVKIIFSFDSFNTVVRLRSRFSSSVVSDPFSFYRLSKETVKVIVVIFWDSNHLTIFFCQRYVI